MQSELLWGHGEGLDLCFVSRGPDYWYRQEAARKRAKVFYFYYITTNLCGGQHGVFIQAEDSVGHYGLVGQEATAHHLQEKHRAQRIKTRGVGSSFPSYSFHLAWNTKKAGANIFLKVVETVCPFLHSGAFWTNSWEMIMNRNESQMETASCHSYFLEVELRDLLKIWAFLSNIFLLSSDFGLYQLQRENTLAAKCSTMFSS